MIQSIPWWLRVQPDIRLARRTKGAFAIVSTGRDDERQFVDGGRAVARGMHEPLKLRVCHGVDGDQKIVEVDLVRRPFIIVCVVSSHDEFSGRDERKLR
jgi:hypothetical protein